MNRLLQTRDIVLVPRGEAPKTDEDDPVDYYYRPLTAPLYRGRLRLAGRLLGPGPFGSLLEVGYGSGVFLPELARRTERLAAIDVHAAESEVQAMLRRFGVEAELRRASLYELPFADGEFDALVCLSVLEHLTDLEGALGSFRRVLRRDGIAVLGFPVRNPVTDLFFRLAGYDPRALHPSGHNEILAEARGHAGFTVEREARFPALLPVPLAPYVGVRLRAV